MCENGPKSAIIFRFFRKVEEGVRQPKPNKIVRHCLWHMATAATTKQTTTTSDSSITNQLPKLPHMPNFSINNPLTMPPHVPEIEEVSAQTTSRVNQIIQPGKPATVLPLYEHTLRESAIVCE